MFFLDNNFYGFVFKLILVFLIIGGLMFAGVSRYIKNFNNPLFLLISSMGMSMYLITLILYYSLMFFCDYDDVFYLSIIVFFLLLLFFWSRKNLKDAYMAIRPYFTETNYVIKLVLLLLTLLFFVGWSYYIYTKKITEHDTLEYAVQGKVFYKDKCIYYDTYRYDKENFFFYVGLHGFSFPLIRTFEMMTNTFVNSGDLFFRSINSIYGGWILLLVFSVFYKITNVKYAFIVVLLLGLNYGFFETIMKYHIDNFRVFFLMMSVVWMYYLMQNTDINSAGVWGIMMGAQSNAHSLGFMIAFIQLLVFFIFCNLSIQKRIVYSVWILFLLFLSGGVHYVIDTFFGTGWIFKDIKFY